MVVPQGICIHRRNATIGGQHDAALRNGRRQVRLHRQVLIARVRVRKVLHVRGDKRRHRDAAGVDILDQVVRVVHRRLVGVGQTVRDGSDDVARSEPEEGRDDRVAVMRVRAELGDEDGAALIE